MQAIKISAAIIAFLFFTNVSQSAEKITCKKYSGKYKEYILSISFSQKGKMLIEVEEKNNGGYFSTPGSYSFKESKVDFFYRGLNRTVYIEKDRAKATPYTFSIDDDFKTEIILMEDKSYPSICN